MRLLSADARIVQHGEFIRVTSQQLGHEAVVCEYKCKAQTRNAVNDVWGHGVQSGAGQAQAVRESTIQFSYRQQGVFSIKIHQTNTSTDVSAVRIQTLIPSARDRHHRSVSRLLKLFAACVLASMMIGCGTTRVVDRRFQTETKYSTTESLEILRTALLKGGITDLDLHPGGFSYKLALTRFGGAMPFTKRTITFAEITKVESVRGPRGDFFYLYKDVDGKEEVCFEGISGRDDALADQVASALFVLCPNLK